MIVSEIIKVKNIDNISTEYVETELKKQNINPLRWAIVNVTEEKLTLSIAYERE